MINSITQMNTISGSYSIWVRREVGGVDDEPPGPSHCFRWIVAGWAAAGVLHLRSGVSLANFVRCVQLVDLVAARADVDRTAHVVPEAGDRSFDLRYDSF